tara:strand:- start:18787 stop:19218 length:432 start_codon:yes stop_codon:yes gene_type:complete
MKFLPVPTEKLDEIWKYAEPIINRAVSITPDRISTDDVYKAIKESGYILWIVVEETEENLEIVATLTTRLIEYPKTKALAIDFVAGSRMKDWLPIVMPVLENLGKVNKCTHIEGYGRTAWTKYLEKYDWKPRHIQYEKRLDNE